MNLSRPELSSLPKTSLHQARNWTKADVYLVEWPPQSGQEVVVKDMAGRPLWFRIFSRYLLKREWTALCALEDISGVPRALHRPDADCFVMEKLDGTPFKSIGRKEIPLPALDHLRQLVSRVHERGVSHGDLHASNVLLQENNQVAVIDWATACVFGTNPTGFKAWTWREWSALDLRSVTKIRSRVAPETMTPDDKARMKGGSPVSNFIRRVGDKIKPGRRHRKRAWR